MFDTAEDEHVVSVEHIGDDGENGENGNGLAPPARVARGAQRNPGSAYPQASLLPDCAALTPGCDGNGASRRIFGKRRP